MYWIYRLSRYFGRLAIKGRVWPGIALIMAFSACAPAVENPLEDPRVPVGAVQVSPALYMVPAGADAVGCPMFQPWSPTLMVVQALHWRSTDGSFTLNRNAADCPPTA